MNDLERRLDDRRLDQSLVRSQVPVMRHSSPDRIFSPDSSLIDCATCNVDTRLDAINVSAVRLFGFRSFRQAAVEVSSAKRAAPDRSFSRSGNGLHDKRDDGMSGMTRSWRYATN